jgi:hypothetical protein
MLATSHTASALRRYDLTISPLLLFSSCEEVKAEVVVQQV